MRSALVLAALSFALPPACAKMMAKKGPAADAASADVAPPPPPPPPPPPVWAPPATAQPVDTAPTPSASASASVAAPTNGPDFAKARAAADAKEWKKVKALLDKRVKSGKGSPDEAQLLVDACHALRDKACSDAVTAKYPGLGSRGSDTP